MGIPSDDVERKKPQLHKRASMKAPLYKKTSDLPLGEFRHNPRLFDPTSVTSGLEERRARSKRRSMYTTPSTSLQSAVEAFFVGDVQKATVFSGSRLVGVMLFHLGLFILLAVLYLVVVHVEAPMQSDFFATVKDFCDLCVSGIVFLLGGFIATMLSRWWAFRSQCCGGLHQSLVCLCTQAAGIWPTKSPVHREARELVARYSLAAYQLLFIEGRAADLSANRGRSGVVDAIRDLVNAGTLKAEEAEILTEMPVPSGVVIAWLAAFWDKVFDPASGLACSTAGTSADNGRMATTFGQLFAARNAISLCHMHMQTQLPYGYIQLILFLVHVTCIANTIFCGVYVGVVVGECERHADDLCVTSSLIPLVLVRVMRVLLVPIVLDGMLLIGTVIAMPLGDDEDDFPAGAFLEALEDDVLAPGAALERLHPAEPLDGKAPQLAVASTAAPP